MVKMNAGMMRGKMALEVAAELYTRHMFTLGNVVDISITPSSKEEQYPPVRMGINGDLMDGMQAPASVSSSVSKPVKCKRRLQAHEWVTKV